MTNKINFKNYKEQIERMIDVANKDDIWGWHVMEITEDHVDLYWEYDVNFRIEFKGDEDISWIKSVHDYGYGLDSDAVEDFVLLIVGSGRYDDVALEDAPVSIVASTISKARRVY